MKNTFGQNVTLTLFGESHGPAIGAVIDGLCPGIEVSEEFIKNLLSRRRPSSLTDTKRVEPDNFNILSGVFNGKTTGTPLTIVIENTNTKSGDYTYGIARPSHADYTAFCKYNGFEDYRGGGHFSGRITAAIVAAAGVIIPALSKFGIEIGTHILECGGISDDCFQDFERDIKAISLSDFPTLNKEKGEEMKAKILSAREASDSIGGVTQTVVYGMPEGIGEPWFDSMESIISHGIFSLGGIKGIEFGKGFDFKNTVGSQCNDEFFRDNGKIRTKTNNNGGINGGISNGMPIIFNCAVKPTPSIGKAQATVDFIKNENTTLNIKGRHDPAIIRRICPVIDSMTAFCIIDMLAAHYGTDFLLNDKLKK